MIEDAPVEGIVAEATEDSGKSATAISARETAAVICQKAGKAPYDEAAEAVTDDLGAV